MKNGILASLILILLPVGAIAQGSSPAAAPKTAVKTAPASKAAADPIVVAFGTTQIRQSELEAAMASIPAEYQQYVQTAGKRAFAEDYLRMKMLASEAVKSGLDKDAAVQAQLTLVRDNALANAQIEKIEKSIVVGDEDLKKAYEAKKAQFETATARHVLIAFKGSPAARPEMKELTEDEAKAKAEGIRTKIVGGADFAELAKSESDDVGSGARGGDLGSFSRGRMVPEFEKAVFEGKIGEVGPVVKTQFGYHVIQVTERKTQSLDDVRTELQEELRGAKVQETLDALKASVKPTFNDAYFGPVVETEAPPAGAAPVSPKP